jgi:hypothetical protein
MAQDRFVTVNSYMDAVQAHMAKAKLEAEGVTAVIANENIVGMNWMLSNAVGGVEVQVPSSQAKRARRILAAVEGGEHKIEEAEVTCPECQSSDCKEIKTTWRVAFLSFFLFHIPLPFSRGEYECRKCGNIWNQKDLDRRRADAA